MIGDCRDKQKRHWNRNNNNNNNLFGRSWKAGGNLTGKIWTLRAATLRRKSSQMVGRLGTGRKQGLQRHWMKMVEFMAKAEATGKGEREESILKSMPDWKHDW